MGHAESKQKKKIEMSENQKKKSNNFSDSLLSVLMI